MTDVSVWRAQLEEKARIIQRLAQTEHGQAFMELLEETFQSGSMMGKDPQETAYNVGQYELVSYLQSLQKVGANTA